MAEVEFELRQWTSPFQHYGPAFWKTIFLSEWGSGCFQDDSSALHSLFTFSSVQSLSRIQLLATPWTAALQASLSITNSRSLLKLMSIESVMLPTISSSGIAFSFCLQSFPTSGSSPISQFFASDGQSIVVLASASVLPMNIQD